GREPCGGDGTGLELRTLWFAARRRALAGGARSAPRRVAPEPDVGIGGEDMRRLSSRRPVSDWEPRTRQIGGGLCCFQGPPFRWGRSPSADWGSCRSRPSPCGEDLLDPGIGGYGGGKPPRGHREGDDVEQLLGRRARVQGPPGVGAHGTFR